MITTHPTAFNNKTDPLLPIGSVKTVVQESQIISHGPQVPPAPLWRILNWYLSRFTSYNGLVSASDAELLVMVSTLREKWKFSVFMSFFLTLYNLAILAWMPDSVPPVYADIRWILVWSNIVTVTGVSSGLYNIFWFPADAGVFKARILNLYGTYAMFSFQSQVPAISTLLSLLLLGLFQSLLMSDGHVAGFVTFMTVFCLLYTLRFWTYGLCYILAGITRGTRLRWQRLTNSINGFGI